MLNEITYFLRAHQCSNISGFHLNPEGDHVRAEGHINAMTLAEFIQILDEVTYILRAR
jgi:hypothetical protein